MRRLKNQILTFVVLTLRGWSLRLESRRIKRVLLRHGVPGLMAVLFLACSPMLADDQQPLPRTTLGAHVGYLNGRVAPEADIGLAMGQPVLGFQSYELTGFAVTAAKGRPVQLEASAVTGVAMLRPLGEYVDFGPVTQFGVANDGKNTGMTGKAGVIADYRFGHSQNWAAEVLLTVTRGPLGNYTPEALLGVRYFGLKAAILPGVKTFKAPKPPKVKKGCA